MHHETRRPAARVDDSTAALERLLSRYADNGRAITVNFRDLAHWLPMGERATHYLHPYPAKLLRHIPAFFLSTELLAPIGSKVLDPFCGSGTVLLESVLSGRDGLGVDSNPLARLISEVKVATLDVARVTPVARQVATRAVSYRRVDVPNVVNVTHWFSPRIIDELARLRRAIDTVTDDDTRQLLLVCLSACVRRVSFADPRVSVPVRLRRNQYPTGHPLRRPTNLHLRSLSSVSAFSEFESIVQDNVGRLSELKRLRPAGVTGHVICDDARSLKRGSRRLPRASVDLVITSPPYAGAQKYIRASSLSIGWLGLGGRHSLRELEEQSIGREHFRKLALAEIPSTGNEEADKRLLRISARNRTRAVIAASYLREMEEAFREVARCLRPGGHLVLVAGNNSICGMEFRTNDYLISMLNALGMTTKLRLVDAIRSRGLMTRRNATASVITREWVTVLRKKGTDRD